MVSVEIISMFAHVDYSQYKKSEFIQRPDGQTSEYIEFGIHNLHLFNPFDFDLDITRPFIANNGRGSIIITQDNQKLYFDGVTYKELADHMEAKGHSAAHLNHKDYGYEIILDRTDHTRFILQNNNATNPSYYEFTMPHSILDGILSGFKSLDCEINNQEYEGEYLYSYFYWSKGLRNMDSDYFKKYFGGPYKKFKLFMEETPQLIKNNFVSIAISEKEFEEALNSIDTLQSSCENGSLKYSIFSNGQSLHNCVSSRTKIAKDSGISHSILEYFFDSDILSRKHITDPFTYEEKYELDLSLLKKAKLYWEHFDFATLWQEFLGEKAVTTTYHKNFIFFQNEKSKDVMVFDERGVVSIELNPHNKCFEPTGTTYNYQFIYCPDELHPLPGEIIEN